MDGDLISSHRATCGTNKWLRVGLSDKTERCRGENGSTVGDYEQCLKWLDSWEPWSVIYACLGSICGLATWQLLELGLGLEASSQPFIWVIRGGERSQGLEKWIQEEGLEERAKGRGFIIRGWAPQVLLLSHRAIGGFLTHCGWNSTLEGVSAGVPLVTRPLFAEQFYNDKLAVQAAVTWGLEDKSGLVIKREKVKEAIEKLMDRGKQGDEWIKRTRQLGEIANRAIGVGASSHRNMEMLIEFVIQRTRGQQFI
ncbi:UDP-glycosyltransferase 73C6 [Citrus sinensis]|nr:UDP-glycosyltransferase 73C6 [Citrus sinensis]